MGKGFLFFPLNLGGVIMRCPDCNKEVGNVSSCPYCGATISNDKSVVTEVVNNDTPKISIDKSAKPLFNKAFLAFGLSIACIIIWYLFSSIILVTFVGEDAKLALAVSFTKKIIVTLFIGLLCSVSLAYSNKLKALPQKVICIMICIVTCIISYILVSIVGVNDYNIYHNLFGLEEIGKKILNFYFGFGMPLTCGSLFIASVGRVKKKATANFFSITLLTLLLSCIISFTTVSVFYMGLQGLLLCCIVPIISFAISLFLK